MARKRKVEESTPEDPAERGGHGATDCPNLETPTGRRKKSTSSRIGRACDRCQHRKLACDADPAGCQPCQKVDAWCTVTDPLTNTPTYRGEFEYLERRVAKQNKDIQDLLSRLRESGQDVSFYHGDNPEEDEENKRYNAWARLKASGDTKPWDRDERLVNGSRHLGSQLPQNVGGSNASSDGYSFSTAEHRKLSTDSSIVLTVPSPVPGRKYAGLSNNDGHTKTEPSTKLNLLGWELDMATFDEDTDDDFNALPCHENPLYDRSYRSFVATTHGQQPRIANVPKPARQEAFKYAEMYISTQAAFTPILHKPTLEQLFTKFYDDSTFQPSPAENVCIHMVFATALDQLARRNIHDAKLRPDYTSRSHQYYHYSIAMFPQLMVGNTLEDMQALALICIHTRHFPRPEVGWMVMSVTFNRLIQLNYHRAASSGEPWVAQKSFLEIEVRKRVFWSVLTILVTASGKLGRPMPIRLEDFDVEIPLPVADERLLETGLDESHPDDPESPGSCYFLVALEAFKIEPIYIELYNSLYAAKRTSEDYEEFVSQAEGRIQRWVEEWHPKFHSTSSTDIVNQVCMRYLESWSLEYRLLLYHPSLTLAKSATFNDTSLRKCLDVAQKWLRVIRVLQSYKALDTTWYNCAVYMLAIQTTLFGHSQLRDELTPAKLSTLKDDMRTWLSIMGDIGNLLGSSTRLQGELQKQINLQLSQLQRHVTAKMKLQIVKTESVPDSTGHKPVAPSRTPSDGSNVRIITSHGGSVGTEYATFNQGQQTHADAYATQSRYASETGSPSLQEYVQAGGYPYASPGRSQFLDSMSSQYASSAPLGMSHQLLHGGPTAGYVPHQVNSDNSGMYMSSADGFAVPGIYGPDSTSWYQYHQILPTGIDLSDSHHSANALLQLGSRPGDHESGINGDFDPTAVPSGGQIWPLES